MSEAKPMHMFSGLIKTPLQVTAVSIPAFLIPNDSGDMVQLLHSKMNVLARNTGFRLANSVNRYASTVPSSIALTVQGDEVFGSRYISTGVGFRNSTRRCGRTGKWAKRKI